MAKRKSTKGVFRIRIWQKNRQHYDQKKKYKRSIQNPYMAEEQTTLWSKEKVQKDKQRSTKHTYKSKESHEPH
jgi:hypothetical protein